MKWHILFLMFISTIIPLKAAWLRPSEYTTVYDKAISNLKYAVKKKLIDPRRTYVVMYNLFSYDKPPYTSARPESRDINALGDCSYNGWRYSLTRLLYPEDWFDDRSQWKEDLYQHRITVDPCLNFPPDTSKFLNVYLGNLSESYKIKAISVEALIKIVPYLFKRTHTIGDLVGRLQVFPVIRDDNLDYRTVSLNEPYRKVQLIKSLTKPLSGSPYDDNYYYLNDGIKNFLHKFEQMDRNKMAQEIETMENALHKGNIFHADSTFAYLIVDNEAPPLKQRNVTKRVLLLTALGLAYHYRKPLWALGKTSLNCIKNQLGYS